VSPAVLPSEDILTGVEKAIVCQSEEVLLESLRILKASSRPRDNLMVAERRAVGPCAPTLASLSSLQTRATRQRSSTTRKCRPL
jgi:hypothetical protein